MELIQQNLLCKECRVVALRSQLWRAHRGRRTTHAGRGRSEAQLAHVGRHVMNPCAAGVRVFLRQNLPPTRHGGHVVGDSISHGLLLAFKDNPRSLSTCRRIAVSSDGRKDWCWNAVMRWVEMT